VPEAGAAVDWAALEARYPGRPAFIAKLVGIALGSVAGVAEELRAAAARGDWRAVGRAAHALRGGAEVIRAIDVGERAARVEAAALAPDGAAGAQVAELALALERLEAELRARAAASPSPAAG
jgi:HPt (histidine-containing phosphotransfer) domain-containing protein